MVLGSFPETRQSRLLIQSQNPPVAAPSARMFVSNETDTATAETRGEPIVNAVVDRVQRAVRTVDRDSGGCAA